MIVFQQIRNATVKLQYPGGTFMIDSWLTDACDPIEREQAVAARRFIPKPVCPRTRRWCVRVKRMSLKWQGLDLQMFAGSAMGSCALAILRCIA